jgi:hypothetical protein
MEKPLLNHFPFTPTHPVVMNVTARFGEDPFLSDHPPDAGTICGVFNAAFWASTQSEEGRSVRVSLALMNPDHSHLTVREWLPSGGYADRPMQNIGGTRHSSAAQFVSRYPGTVIFVASQDGRFTIFCCNEDGTEVLAHRVELLLL